MHSEPLINVADYARAARRTLSKDVLDYYEGGALDEIRRPGEYRWVGKTEALLPGSPEWGEAT